MLGCESKAGPGTDGGVDMSGLTEDLAYAICGRWNNAENQAAFEDAIRVLLDRDMGPDEVVALIRPLYEAAASERDIELAEIEGGITLEDRD